MPPSSLYPFVLRRSAALYIATFQEPAFALLGNPAVLFGSLLKHLAPFGARLEFLSMDTSSLPGAYVSCRISADLVARVKVDGLEVFAKPSDLGTEGVQAFAESAWSAVAASEANLRIVKQEVTLNLWGRLEGRTFREFIPSLVNPIRGASFDGMMPELEWRGSDGAIAVEESRDDPGGVFFRTVATYPGEISLAEVGLAFKGRVRSLLEGIGIDAGPKFT